MINGNGAEALERKQTKRHYKDGALTPKPSQLGVTITVDEGGGFNHRMPKGRVWPKKAKKSAHLFPVSMYESP